MRIRRSLPLAALALVLPFAALGGQAAAQRQAPTRRLATPSFHVMRVWRGLNAPTYVTAPRGDRRLFATEQRGRILVRTPAGVVRTFLDMRSITTGAGGEQGLLSIAFSPAYATNGRFYVYFNNSSGDVEIDEFHGSGLHAALSSRRRLLVIPHRWASNHNGGQLQFGPDGLLYIGTGDGGGGGESAAVGAGYPNGAAQTRTLRLGKLLRIDVSRRSAGLPYAIPASNPFARSTRFRREILSLGLRNPWRFSFDRETGDLWIGDVGQDTWEEIDRVARGTTRYRNFGWSRYEGRSTFNAARHLTSGLLTWPIHVYNHSGSTESGCSITGGYVYRGSVTALKGWYVYTDYCSTGLRLLRWSNGRVVAWRRHADSRLQGVSSFGQGGAGGLYVVSQGTGAIYRITK